jgi:hypothetical protein
MDKDVDPSVDFWKYHFLANFATLTIRGSLFRLKEKPA